MHMQAFRFPNPTASARRQRGVSLLFALLTLVALMLSTLALVRSVDTGALMVGNVGFKQDATAAADQAARAAIDWLTANKNSLNVGSEASNATPNGYYANNQEFLADGVTARPPVDATGQQIAGNSRRLIDWDRDSCRGAVPGSFTDCTIVPVNGTDVGDNTVRYVIFRMCSKAGDYSTDSSIQCAKHTGTGEVAAEDHGDLSYVGRAVDSASATPYFRILVRVAGARNTVSFTETLVHF